MLVGILLPLLSSLLFITIIIIYNYRRGDFVKEGDKLEDGIIFDFNNKTERENRKKKINISALFGPEKTSGISLLSSYSHHHD